MFAVRDEAFSQAPESVQNSQHLASFHLVGAAVPTSKFPTTITSTKQIAAPLTLTFKDPHPEDRDASGLLPHAPHQHNPASGEREYYVNNARIIQTLTGYRSTQGLEQVLYIIDELLEPFIPSGAGIAPTANELLQGQISYENSLDAMSDIFAGHVRNFNLEGLFSRPGNNTFFIPLIRSSDRSRVRNLDEAIVKAHVITNRALYFRTLESNTEYRTAAWDDMTQVGVSLPTPPEAKSTLRPNSNRIQSRTHKAAANHHIGLVRTAIVRANIPVRNGVVHLIEKPFMVVDISTWDFLESNKDGQISSFAKYLYRSQNLLSQVRDSRRELTIFAPNNRAFEQLGPEKLERIENNQTYCEELMGLHIVQGLVSSEEVRNGNKRELLSLDGRRNLYFQVAHATENTQVLTVEGGGVNSTAVQADIGATNGVIHVVDKVLGIPFQTVFRKMADDFDMSTTYLIGSHRNNLWNRRLDTESKRFTFFVPSKAAWDKLRVTMPSEYKQLTEGQLPVHGEQVCHSSLMMSQDIP